MITSGFKKICSLGVFHTYFENNLCTCLEFLPDDRTEDMLRKYGFRLRATNNGFDLFYSGNVSAADMLNYIARTTAQNYFEFTFTSINDSFLLFTDLSLDWLGQISFDSSSSLNRKSDGVIELVQKLETNSLVSDPGVIRIYFSDIIENNNPAFRIDFNARATQWQYYIVNRSAAILDNPSINGKPPTYFSGPEDVTIPTGQRAILFSSGDLLPLSEVPKYKFDLVNNSSAITPLPTKKATAGKVILKGLPHPDPGNIGIVEVEGKKQTASPIYVYV